MRPGPTASGRSSRTGLPSGQAKPRPVQTMAAEDAEACDMDTGVSLGARGVGDVRWETPRHRNAGVRRVRRGYAEVADGPREA
ncbi:hypothetical protein San01_56590 [Streptomyces angustmyceticus]|uniref:Uncharacterized protein n=1 Tax=Streptomyces angustmyceticus TaxID=285578 RepID=A0A5J4LMB3_9ACTN|nr:hypothetical protein San01_56590 [Streptomyces angustmyceticus]